MSNRWTERGSILIDQAFWLRVLSRWSLAVAIATMVLPVLIFLGIGQAASDMSLGSSYVELLQAVRTPSYFRMAWMLDAIIWLLIGVCLVLWAIVLIHRTPRLALIAAVCGLGQLFGASAGFKRVNGTADFAQQLSQAGESSQQYLLRSYGDLIRIVNAEYHFAVLLLGVGYVAIACAVWSRQGVPRWLGPWMAVPGGLALVQFLIVALGMPCVAALSYIDVVVGNVALNLAIAWVFWRPNTQM